ncbi:MAG: ABC transporter permease [Actinomycetota bacterium]|nr:ABC transporter permease [Actinomycetota bacterium]
MGPVGRLLAANPVLDRELRQRSRSRRSMIVLVAYLLLLLGAAVLIHLGESSSFGDTRGWVDPWSLPEPPAAVGRTMLEWLLAAMLVILLFVVPGISANAVTGERERQTLVPLQVSLVGPTGILVGKVGASSAFALLLLVAAAPLLAIPYLIGGVSLSQVLLSLGVLAATAVILAGIGVTCSALFRRTQAATLVAYGIVLFLVIGTPVALAALAVIDSARGTDDANPPLEVLYPNPFIALADAAGDVSETGNGPFSPLKSVLRDDEDDFAAGAAVNPVPMAEPAVATFVVEVEEAVEAVEAVEADVIEIQPGGRGIGLGDDVIGAPVVIDESGGPGRDWFPVWAQSLTIQIVLVALLGVFAWRRLRAPSAVDR